MDSSQDAKTSTSCVEIELSSAASEDLDQHECLKISSPKMNIAFHILIVVEIIMSSRFEGVFGNK